jgi:hypothetical protein
VKGVRVVYVAYLTVVLAGVVCFTLIGLLGR